VVLEIMTRGNTVVLVNVPVLMGRAVVGGAVVVGRTVVLRRLSNWATVPQKFVMKVLASVTCSGRHSPLTRLIIEERMLQMQKRSDGTQADSAMELKMEPWVHSVRPRIAAGTKAGSFCGTALVEMTSDVITVAVETKLVKVMLLSELEDDLIGRTLELPEEELELLDDDLVGRTLVLAEEELDEDLDEEVEVLVGRTVVVERMVEVMVDLLLDDVRVGRTVVVLRIVEVVVEVEQEVEVEVLVEVVSQSEVELELLEE
jgi:hypothetical protein